MLEEKQIKEALELMDKRVQKIVGCRTEKEATTRYVYKKLELVGETEEYFKDAYFESISEADFNSTAGKHLLSIDTLKLTLSKDLYEIAGIEVQTNTQNGTVFKHHG